MMLDVDVCNIGFAFISSETQSVPLRLVTSKDPQFYHQGFRKATTYGLLFVENCTFTL